MQNLKRVLARLFKDAQSENETLVPMADDRIKSLMDCLSTTQDNEADCSQFDAQMDCLAELLAEGKASGEVLTPEIEAHLRHSVDCREEFEALIAILKAEAAGEIEETY